MLKAPESYYGIFFTGTPSIMIKVQNTSPKTCSIIKCMLTEDDHIPLRHKRVVVLWSELYTDYVATIIGPLWYSNKEPHAGSGVVRMDPIRFLAGCRTKRLNHG